MHVQLGALLDMVPLHGPDSAARYPAPWRPDPRPAGALLQGTYAHLGVADFWRTEALAEAEQDAAGRRSGREEYLRWRGHTLGAARILLDSGELTAPGTRFTAELLRTAETWEPRLNHEHDQLTMGVSGGY
jgi:HEXXH motif-containing protein